jgi:hypothetical protein
MTMPVPFDTHAYIQTLTEAGLTQDQAEAHAQALTGALVNAAVSPSQQVLLKAEFLARMAEQRAELLARMDDVRAELLARIDDVRAELLARMEEVRTELLARIVALERTAKIQSWMIGATLLLQGVTLAVLVPVVLKLLP